MRKVVRAAGMTVEEIEEVVMAARSDGFCRMLDGLDFKDEEAPVIDWSFEPARARL